MSSNLTAPTNKTGILYNDKAERDEAVYQACYSPATGTDKRSGFDVLILNSRSGLVIKRQMR